MRDYIVGVRDKFFRVFGGDEILEIWGV